MNPSLADTLSPQQLRCLHLVARGYGSGEIARELGIAESTVNGHLAAAVAKLGAPNRRRAAAMLIEPPQILPGHNLRVDGTDRVSHCQPPARVSEETDDWPSGPGPLFSTQPTGREVEHDQLIRTLKVAVLVLTTAAAVIWLVAQYPTLIRSADDIYNALPPTNIKAQ